MMGRRVAAGLAVMLGAAVGSRAQAGYLDPTRGVVAPAAAAHAKLAEEYIWTRGGPRGGDGETQPRYFRVAFDVAGAVPEATLYVAGPRSAKVYLNGELVDRYEADLTAPFDFKVFATELSGAHGLRAGRNVLAIEMVRGKGGSKATTMPATIQQANGKVLVAKILPGAPWMGDEAKPLLVSDGKWRGALGAAAKWMDSGFDDSKWAAVTTLGPIEGDINLLQWNADAGMYNWPGYAGISPFLREMAVPAAAVTHVYAGRNTVEGATAGRALKVTLAAPMLEQADAPSMVFDFGQETVGRLKLTSASAAPVTVTVEYGESEGEVLNQPFLGAAELTLAPGATGYGPKSAFRYARVRFLGSAGPIELKPVELEAIFYPVTYQGTFESSDALVNKIWETGAYTAHLCMQDDIWDAPKRDRGRWAGDLDVSGRVIDDVFADRMLMEDTLRQLVDDRGARENVNGIPGYSALWISALNQYYLHTGSMEFLKSMKGRMTSLLAVMDSELDGDHLFADRSKQWPFVDWTAGLAGDTPDARRGTQFEDIRAFHEAAFLLREMDDGAAADGREAMAGELTKAAQARMLDGAAGTFGDRWQVNSMAVLSGAATAGQYGAIWSKVLTHTADDSFREPPITPFYNAYVIAAMAQTGHRKEALDWIRMYWGGMIEEGATSTWEAYDTHWPKRNPHVSLEADNTSGYYVSLAHGWSSGPTSWLMEEVLGVRPTTAGFRTAMVRPDLAGLSWAKGVVPTPLGPISVDVQGGQTTVTMPEGMELSASVPVARAGGAVLVNGARMAAAQAEDGRRAVVVLRKAGTYVLKAE